MTQEKQTIALFGAGGKMGCRITDNLKDHPDYDMLYVDSGETGLARMRERGTEATPADDAIERAGTVILAVPDVLIGRVAGGIVPRLRSGALVITLDPAAAHAGELPEREDIAFFVTHPCHPPLFGEREPEEMTDPDWFGGVRSPQSIVCALHHGPEPAYERGEALARLMYQPILRSHRVTVAQMAMLEPAIVETTTASLILACREAMERGIAMGIPKEAAWDFVMGHIRTELAIIFGYADFPFSDGAKAAMKEAQSRIFKEGWLDTVLDPEEILKSVRSITRPAD